MRKWLLWGMLGVLSVGSLAGCGAQNTEKEEQHGISIVTTLFPQYDFARNIVGDDSQIKLLLTPGMESHSYEPTAADIIAINQADVFIYTGADMEAWAEKVLDSLDSDVTVIDLSQYVVLDLEDEHEEHEEEEEEHVHTYDPHIWTSPKNAILMTEGICEILVELDSENEELYRQNCAEYVTQLEVLSASFEELAKESQGANFVFGGRFAFHYLFRDYGWNYVAAYNGCSTETEPSTKKIAEMVDYINENDINVVYYEELTEPTVAKSISEATGTEMLLLHSCHNVTQEELQEGVSYISLMEQNLENLRAGLSKQ
ncbi:MAG: metal ABC transporter substrate-binding protein [Lachnospiraceae bacterium]